MTRRFTAFLLLLAFAGCSKIMATRIDDRTFAIEGPGISGGSTAPNKRLAQQLCPGGYRVLDDTVRYNTPDGYRFVSGEVFTNWVIRCI
jgi:hypothetical protein